jgi:putative photosynthetic complex assembly protein
MTTAHRHDLAIPRGPIIGGAALIGATLIAVAAVRLAGVDISSRSQAPAVAERQLHFDDLPDGSISVRDADAAPGTVLRVVPPGGDGFLRGTLRALVRQRRLAEVGPQAPFRLTAHADGRLTLDDPATGQRIDLEAFGPTNAAVFAELLPPAPATRTAAE